MIREQVVFVLGAGAHQPYGMPVGDTLRNDIVAMMLGSRVVRYQRQEITLLDLVRTMAGHEKAFVGVDQNMLGAFAEALQYSGQPSIDSFLEKYRNNHLFVQLGKLAITARLLPDESHERLLLNTVKRDWIVYLFRLMSHRVQNGIEFAASNAVAFVTFNYDRLLEHRLYCHIRYSYGLDDEAASAVLSQIPIFHVYGQLGAYAPPGRKGLNAEEVMFGAEPTAELYLKCMKAIRLIHEVEPRGGLVPRFATTLEAWEKAVFLGFSFLPENMAILRMPDSVRAKKALAACRFGMSDGEVLRVTDGARRLNLGWLEEGDDALDTLRAVTFLA
jgi:hypothetical protein